MDSPEISKAWLAGGLVLSESAVCPSSLRVVEVTCCTQAGLGLGLVLLMGAVMMAEPPTRWYCGRTC